MELPIKKLLVTTGAVMGMAVALVPLTSYAAPVTGVPATTPNRTEAVNSGNSNMKVNVVISDYISLDAASGGNTIGVSADQVGTGQISASVSSTRDYTISLKAVSNPALTQASSSNSIPAGSAVQIGNSAWGIKKQGESNYTALTTTSTVFYTGTGQGDTESIQTTFDVGVSVAPTVPMGDYSTDIEVLAAVKQ